MMSAGAGEGIEDETRTILGGAAGDVVAAERAGDLVEDAEIVGDEADGDDDRAFVFKGAILDRDEDDRVELLAGVFGGSANGEGGLAHAARTGDECAPDALFRAESIADLREFLFAPVEVVEAREVVRDGGLEDGWRWR